MEKICRICCQTDNLTSIFSVNDLSHKIMACASVNIQERDGLPSNMCEPCIKNLDMVYSFKTKCERTDKFFHLLLSSKEASAILTSEIILEKYFYYLNKTIIKTEQENLHEGKKVFLNSEIQNTFGSNTTTQQTRNDFFIKENKSNTKDADASDDSNSANKDFFPETFTHSNEVNYSLPPFIQKQETVFENDTKINLLNNSAKANILTNTSDKSTDLVQSSSKERKTKKGKTSINNKKNENLYECNLCSKSFSKPNAYKIHIMQSHSKDSRKKFKCDTCEKNFNRKETLIIHNRIHTGEKPYHCSICSKQFSHRSACNLHMKSHNTETVKSFQCDICGKGFNRKATLIIHSRIHTGEKPYQCHICMREFRQKSACKLHMKSHSGEPIQTFQCDVCGRVFTRKAVLLEHIRRIHSDKTLDQKTTSSHSHVSTTMYPCSFCGKKFPTPYRLKCHVRIHTGEKNYVCDLCGKGFIQSCSLRVHYRAHRGIKDVECTLCGQFFAGKSDLKGHEKRAHLQKKDYQCNECDKSFVTNTELKRHVFGFHKKEKPFTCKYCNRKFSFIGNFNYHVKKRHTISSS